MREPWQGVPGIKAALSEARAQLKFGDIELKLTSRKNARARQTKTFDTTDRGDRRAIESAMNWLRDLADERGLQQTDALKTPDAYHWP